MNSEGIPLEVVLSRFHDGGFVLSWPDFIDEAISYNWNLNSLRTKISSCTGDVHGPFYRDDVLKKFDSYIKNKRA